MTTSMDMSMATGTMTMDMSMPTSMAQMASEDMAMAFFSGTGTSLYTMQFTPSTTAGYAGACIFLIVLSILARSLLAFRTVLEARWTDQARQRRYVVVADRQPEAERVRADSEAKTGVLTANGVEEQVRVVHSHRKGAQPWRFSVDLPRALLVTVVVGIGYLLMLAVMTFNVGYFGSILGGVFIGEVLVGRYSTMMDEHGH